ncbi:hypothetical protein EIKCOROL_02491 [Eikenella corrodens ATCC 23834]|uniref:Uncharacterized protein n=1 Tax=Eikenella corrodens ATCC 23834 TaxID=546274 RepID=C0DYM5_EIKCO|nr:hypothetical protein EIKCOROL_02491 [Eikenella corrodens ATCC 23834]
MASGFYAVAIGVFEAERSFIALAMPLGAAAEQAAVRGVALAGTGSGAVEHGALVVKLQAHAVGTLLAHGYRQAVFAAEALNACTALATVLVARSRLVARILHAVFMALVMVMTVTVTVVLRSVHHAGGQQQSQRGRYSPSTYFHCVFPIK